MNVSHFGARRLEFEECFAFLDSEDPMDEGGPTRSTAQGVGGLSQDIDLRSYARGWSEDHIDEAVG